MIDIKGPKLEGRPFPTGQFSAAMVPNPGAKTLLALMALCLWAETLLAREFHQVGASRGLDARVVASMLVDRYGFLWVGSREGLYRFDGYQATAWTTEPDSETVISDTDIRVLYEGADGSIWVGTNTGGLNRLDPVSGIAEHYRHESDNPDSLPEDSVYGIVEDAQGLLWVATQRGLGRLDRGSGQFEHFAHNPGDATSLSHHWAYALHLGPTGDLWVGTIGGGLNRWNPETGGFERFDLAGLTQGPPGRNDVFALHQSPDGQLWAGTRDGLVVFEPATGQAQWVDLRAQSSRPPLITSVAPDGKGKLWLGTMNSGALIVDLASRAWTSATTQADSAGNGLPDTPIVALAMGSDQVFLGTWGDGVYRGPIQALGFSLVPHQGSESKLRHPNVSAVLATDRPGFPWAGSFGGGPQQLDIGAGVVLPTQGQLDNIRVTGVLDMAHASDGSYWAATTRGLFQFDHQGGEISRHVHQEQPGGLGTGYAYALLTEDEGGLWVGMGGSGLFYRAAGETRFQRFSHDASTPDSLSGDFVTDLEHAGAGHLWVATRSNGLNRCRIEPWSCEQFTPESPGDLALPHHHVTALFRDRRGRTWFATDGGGLSLVIEDNAGIEGFRQFGVSEGLLNNSIMAIEEDVDESLWLSTRHGLSRFHPDSGRVVNFVVESGLPVSHFNTKAAAADDDFVYFGSVEGLLAIRKGSLLLERQAAPVRITRIKTGGQGAQPAPIRRDVNQVAVAYGDIITLEFASLDLSESTHDYQYRLNDSDDWTDLGAQHQIIFHGLAPGRYDFQARGRDVFGRWGASRVLPIIIVPPYWMTGWFRLVLVVFLVLLASGLHRLHLARQRRRAEEMRRLGEKRESALEQALGSKAELAVLTPRQKEVLQMLAEGYTMREIAGLLEVSIKTVETHRANLMERLDIYDLPGLVRLAIRARLVSPYE